MDCNIGGLELVGKGRTVGRRRDKEGRTGKKGFVQLIKLTIDLELVIQCSCSVSL